MTHQADTQLPRDRRWQFWIDRGGTFTDVVARRPDGQIVTHKVLSENPERYRDSAVQGIRDLLGVAAHEPVPAHLIDSVRMGTTVATNALLERKGAPTVLAITRGFADALRIGYQSRPKLFVRNIELPTLLYERVVEIDERIGAHGEVVRELDTRQAQAALRQAYENGIRSCAIVLMHGYRYAEHERRLKEIAQDIGYTQISVSHEVSPLMKLVARGDTTVVDAYLSPILRHYVSKSKAIWGCSVAVHAEQWRPHRRASLPGQGRDPVRARQAASWVRRRCRSARLRKIIGFDMGGTSTDVIALRGRVRTRVRHGSGGRAHPRADDENPYRCGWRRVDLRFRRRALARRPRERGGEPGPASYRRGGPLTVTDCNVMTGKISAQLFPHVFGPEGDLPLDRRRTREVRGARGADSRMRQARALASRESPRAS